MKLVNWNIEWMNDWFVGGNLVQFRSSYSGSHGDIADIDALANRVASVITNLDPDVLTIQEGPSDIREMNLFVNNYLVDASGHPKFQVFPGIDGGAQKIYVLVNNGGRFTQPTIPNDDSTIGLQEVWLSDVDGDFNLEQYDFTRLPLVIDGIWTQQNSDINVRIVVLHTKSKYVHRGEELWMNPDTRQQFIIEALKNRRRISTEAMRTRRYLDDMINHEVTDRIIVTGDFNDGPGKDFFERHYLTHNVTDILLGSTYFPELLFTHGFISRIPVNDRYTAVFDDYVDEIDNRPLLLDHILVSPLLSNSIQFCGVAHSEYEAEVDNTASGRQILPSDHRPVFIELA